MPRVVKATPQPKGVSSLNASPLHLNLGRLFVASAGRSSDPVLGGLFLLLLEVQQPLPTGLDNDLVVDVREVHYKLYIEAKVVSQDAPDDVGRNIIASMTQMGLIVDGRAASIPGDLALLNRYKRDGPSRLQRVVDFDRVHGADCPNPP